MIQIPVASRNVTALSINVTLAKYYVIAKTNVIAVTRLVAAIVNSEFSSTSLVKERFW